MRRRDFHPRPQICRTEEGWPHPTVSKRDCANPCHPVDELRRRSVTTIAAAQANVDQVVSGAKDRAKGHFARQEFIHRERLIREPEVHARNPVNHLIVSVGDFNRHLQLANLAFSLHENFDAKGLSDGERAAFIAIRTANPAVDDLSFQ